MSEFNDMVDFIKSACPARRYIVPCMEGPAGIGKTAATKQAAKELAEEGLMTGKVVTIIASQILPNEVSGITMPVVENKAMEIFDHFRLSSLKDGDVLFFDELLEADELVLSACLTLIESRELMSGRKLPDVMIVAATNPTIKPNMLKENIRQRFVWRKFDVDVAGCREYIKKTCGFDVGPDIANMVRSTGDDYNILTPRSLTKMAQWLSDVEDDRQRLNVAKQIDAIWHSRIGSEMLKKYNAKHNSSQAQVRRAIRESIIHECGWDKMTEISDSHNHALLNDDFFEQCSITELMETLQQLPEWNEIRKRLASIEIKEEDDEIVSF